jgi:hypothetical protein
MNASLTVLLQILVKSLSGLLLLSGKILQVLLEVILLSVLVHSGLCSILGCLNLRLWCVGILRGLRNDVESISVETLEDDLTSSKYWVVRISWSVEGIVTSLFRLVRMW